MSLKLLAFDSDDLTVLSTYVQDALTKVGALRWHPQANRFELILNRYRWEQAGRGGDQPAHQRGMAALHFSRVQAVRSTNINQQNPDGVLSVLAVTFEPGAAPAGDIVISFADGGTVQLSVECVEAQLADTGGVWQASSQPSHAAADQTDSE